MAPPVLVLNQPSDEAVGWVTRRLADASLAAVCTFDLKEVLAAAGDRRCPVHGEQPCDCRMVVLLVYDGGRQPVSLVVHGRDQSTAFYLINTPEQHASPQLEKAVIQALTCSLGQTTQPPTFSEA